MISFLPNMRWFALTSEDGGRDWFERCQEIDRALASSGMDLDHEAVYLLFSDPPSDVLEGKGQCLIARPVIGPKKTLDAPFKLIDWVAAPVWQDQLQGATWEEFLEAAEDLRLKAQKEGNFSGKSFRICIQRRLVPELQTEMSVMFNE